MLLNPVNLYFAICVSAISCAIMNTKNDLNLELIQVVFRHGERTPIEKEVTAMKIDPCLYEPYRLGQMTYNGKMQEFRIGLMLREKYNDFLNFSYNPNLIHSQASDTDRTKLSLQLVLAGLFPPSKDFGQNLNIPWTHKPFFYVPRKYDHLLWPHDNSKYKELLRKVFEFPEYIEKMSKYSDFLNFVEKETGINFKTNKFLSLYSLFSTLHIHEKLNLPLPKWYTSEVKEFLKEISELLMNVMSWTTELKRRNGGKLVRKFVENMNIDNIDINPKKIYLYSAHDLNIAAYLKAHSIDDALRYPDFGSAVILEKWRDSQNKLYVKMLAWDGIKKELINLRIGNCRELCPMNEYIEIIKNVFPLDEETN